MKRKGSIIITVLLVFIVVLMGALYMLYSSVLQSNILKNQCLSNQGYYSSESKIFMALYDEKYYKEQLFPIVLEQFRQNKIYLKEEVLLDKADIAECDNQRNIIAKFEMLNNRKCLKLIGSTAENNQITSVSSVYTIVRGILEQGLPILHNDYLCSKDQEDLKDYFKSLEDEASIEGLPRQIIGVSTFDIAELSINVSENKNKEFIFYRNNTLIKTEKYPDIQYLIIMRDKYNKGINLHINSPDYPTVLDGIIYVEGDLLISSEFKFNGILIINGGKIIVNSDTNPIINGIIISNGEEGWIDTNKIIINSNPIFIYKYGTYLPGFFDYNFVVMKKLK